MRFRRKKNPRKGLVFHGLALLLKIIVQHPAQTLRLRVAEQVGKAVRTDLSPVKGDDQSLLHGVLFDVVSLHGVCLPPVKSLSITSPHLVPTGHLRLERLPVRHRSTGRLGDGRVKDLVQHSHFLPGVATVLTGHQIADGLDASPSA